MGAFLSALSVQGFRGVGPETTINLSPRPGLTIIAGRNGSGKSSLAEALEYALTSTTYRWRQGTRFTEQWRNLHRPEPCRVTVELAQTGVGRSTIAVDWVNVADSKDAGRVTYQPYGKPRQHGLAALGWERALETYRPLLTYEELGALLRERPSDLHDKIKRMLGLDALADADERLKARLNPLKQPVAANNRDRLALRKRAEDVDDERARLAVTLLKRTQPDRAALRALVTGTHDVSPQARTLRDIATVGFPEETLVREVATRLGAATAAEAELADEASALEELRRDLLQHALRYVEQSGDGVACPVCEQGRLDGEWRARTSAVLATSDLLETQRQEVRAELQRARRAVRALILRPPDVLTQQQLSLASQTEAERAWQSWFAHPETDAALVEHLETAYGSLVDAVAAWQAEAAAFAVELDETWQPLAVAIGAWIESYEEAQRQEDLRARLEAARKCLLAVEKILRKERMAPIVDHAREIWGHLRQESNVDLDDIDLTGSATSRDVSITASVDGAAAGGLSVMSQGELHALALALFLPRAALPESPFQFILLDDPVQALDPSKVDGLARVLADLARTHQVVVLTHDDRLPQAGRRLHTPPRILEVTRHHGSHVVVHESFSPTRRYLADADALCKDLGVPEVTRRAVLPGVLRQALEAACYERYYTDRLRSGTPIVDVESAWASATTTRQRVQLAVGELELSPWQSRAPERRRALSVCGSGGHASLAGDTEEAVGDVRRTVRDVELAVR